jgi:hypothetical protein
MKTLRKLTIVIVLVCLICNVASFGEEPTKAKPELNFKISSGVHKLNTTQQRRYDQRFGSGGEYIGYEEDEEYDYGGGGKNEVATETSSTDKPKKIKPTHSARMGGINQLFAPSCFEPDALLKTPSGQNLSDLQKEFVKQGNACEVSSSVSNNSVLKTQRLRGITLFAVTEDDAKKMVSAFIESWHNNMGAEVQKILEKKREFEKKPAELQKLYDESVKNRDAIKKILQDKSSEGSHSLDGDISYNSQVQNVARQTARELYLKLNSANIEIEVIKARLSAATVYQARENGNPTVQAKLEEILCEQTIEMAGALERQACITKTLQQEEEIYRLYVQFRIAFDEAKKCRNRASVAEHNLKLAIEEFERIDSSYPCVTANKVVISPVEF